MATDGDGGRLQEILASLVARRIAESLARVEEALAAWRRGERDALQAHAETLRHAARASALSARVARAGLDGPAALVRDAYDAGLLDAEEFRQLVGRPVDEVPPPPSLDEEAGREAPVAMPEKREVLGKLLQDGPVLLHLDSRRDGVEVPDGHRGDPKLVLRVGYGLSPPIPDLTVDADGVQATLAFRGTPHRCRIPWPAVYALVAEDGRGLVWPDDVPPEVARDFAREARGDASASSSDEPSGPKPKRGHLKLV